MDTLAARRRELMLPKSFDFAPKKRQVTTHGGHGSGAIKMGSQSLVKQGNWSPVVKRNKIQTSTIKERPQTRVLEESVHNFDDVESNFICDDLRKISKSLDCLKNTLTVQHREIIRDVESKIKSVNNSIISDIDRIRENLHSLESLVRNRSLDSGINGTRSEDDLDEYTVTSEDNLLSRCPWSPSSISTCDSLGSKSSPGAKSQESGVFFDESTLGLNECSVRIQRENADVKRKWRASTGSTYNNMQACHQSDWLPSVSTEDTESANNNRLRQNCSTLRKTFENKWYQPVTSRLKIHERPDRTIACDTSYYSCSAEQTSFDVLDGSECVYDLSNDKYSSTTYLECLLPKEDTLIDQGEAGIFDDQIHVHFGTNCDNVLCRTYDWGFFSEATVFDWRWNVSRFLWEQWFYPGLTLDFFGRLQIKLEANKTFREDMVRTHNSFRVFHGCQNLTESDDLTKDAQMWADIIAEKSFLQYSELPGRGENVAFLDTNGQAINAADVTRLWYEQMNNYDYNIPKWQKDSMNFTQLIWKSSSDIGVGIAKVKGQDRCVVVVQYRPAGNGNMPGEFRKNVLPPQ